MKRFSISILTVLAATVMFVSCGEGEKKTASNDPQVSTDVVNIPSTASGNTAEPGSTPVITFEKDVHDFGKITQGEKVSYSFKFTNTGGTDLVISSATAQCGCTVPEYPKKPIPPGGEGKIDVVFDSNGKSGKTTKTVNIVTNATPSTRILTINTEIIVPEEK
jgi:hypothetical protein